MSQKSRNKVILQDTNTSILEVSKAQVVLRSLSVLPPPAPGRGVASMQGRPLSAETCLEYQDIPDNRYVGGCGLMLNGCGHYIILVLVIVMQDWPCPLQLTTTMNDYSTLALPHLQINRTRHYSCLSSL